MRLRNFNFRLRGRGSRKNDAPNLGAQLAPFSGVQRAKMEGACPFFGGNSENFATPLLPPFGGTSVYLPDMAIY